MDTASSAPEGAWSLRAPRRGDMSSDAWLVAETAMRRASVEIRPLQTLADMTAACRLLDDVWQIPPGEVSEVRPSLLRALGHGGNYLVGAYRTGGSDAGQMLAASVAFFGVPLGESMHSHITGALPGAGRGVGSAVKWHQRAWAVERGLRRITWTYDPLIARNSFFNLTRLGARTERYFVDFYGPMDDGPNRGQPTDRTDAVWDLESPSTAAAAAGALEPAIASAGPDVDALRAAGVPAALSVGPGGEPVGGPVGGSTAATGAVLVGIPSDIEALRRSDPALALRWRLALRAVLAPMLAGDRWRITGFAKSGWYALERETGR